MSENSVMPSLDKIMNAVNSDLIDPHKNQVPDRKSFDKNESIFDASKWYLQDYPKKVNIKKEDKDKTIYSASNDEKNPEKSGVVKTIGILIAVAVIALIGFCLYFSYENSQYPEANYYDANQIYEENSYYDMELTVGSSDTRYIDLNETVVYSFTPSVSDEYTFYSISENTDPDCKVYNSSNELIGEDDEDGDVYYSNTFIAGETYYFHVYVYENGANVTVNLD